MLKRMVLGSLMIFVLITSTVFAVDAEDFQVQPDKIVLNSIKGTADTIKVSFPYSSIVTDVELFIIRFGDDELCPDEEDCDEVLYGFKYCPDDDILHIYFPKDVVIGFLGDHGIVGDDVGVYLEVDIYYEDLLIEQYKGNGTVEVVNPSKKEFK